MAAKILYCPICRKEVALDSVEVPFCSERCRTIDLGKWASGEYRIPRRLWTRTCWKR